MRSTLAPFSLSNLEQGRVTEADSSWSELASFRELEPMIGQSLAPEPASPPKAAALSKTSSLKASLSRGRPIVDETLLQKLLQYRNQLPPSSRIIRAAEAGVENSHET